MRTNNKTELPSQFIILVIFFAVLLALQAFIKPGVMDDAVYMQVLHEKPIGMFLRDRYNGWSSRIVIEAVMMLLIALNPWVWRILNILMVMLLVWNTADLFAVGKGCRPR